MTSQNSINNAIRQVTAARTVASNGNTIPHNFLSTASRVQNVRRKRTLALNANWTLPRLSFANWVDNSTSETVNYPTIVLRQSIKYAGTIYRAQYSGVYEVVVPVGTSIESDDIVTPSMTAGSEVEICTRIMLPLLFKTQTVNFQIGETVTGGTSAATGVIASQIDSGATGSLVLLSETGTFVDGETLTGSLGGAAVVDLTTTQSLVFSAGAQSIWNEGIKAGNDSTVDWTASDPVVYPVYTANLSGGNITSVTKGSGGSGWTSGASLLAWEVQANGTIASKAIGYANISGGQVTSGSITSGTPPAGATWTNPHVLFAGGPGFGATTAIPDASLLTAIPSTPVKSVILIGDSIGRGYSSSDGVGDLNHNFGVYERAIANRFGVINMSTAGGAAGNQVQFATTFARQYNFYMGKATHALIQLGTNDIVVGTSKATLEGWINTLANYVRSFGTSTALATIIQREKPMAITGATKANPCVITAVNTLTNGDLVTIASVGGMTQLNGNIYTVAGATGTTFQLSGIDSTAYGTYTSGGTASCYNDTAAQTPDTGFSAGSVCDQYNIDVLNGTMLSDWGPVQLRPTLQDGSISTAWKTTPSGLTDDFIHPSLIGLAYAGTDATFKSYFNTLR